LQKIDDVTQVGQVSCHLLVPLPLGDEADEFEDPVDPHDRVKLENGDEVTPEALVMRVDLLRDLVRCQDKEDNAGDQGEQKWCVEEDQAGQLLVLIEKTLPLAKVRPDGVEDAIFVGQVLDRGRGHRDEQGRADGVENVHGQALLLRSLRFHVGRLKGSPEDDEGQDVHPEEGVQEGKLELKSLKV